jgi:hypothetical protein
MALPTLPGSATGTKAAALAAERQQMLGVAGVAAQAQEPVLQPTALQVAVECLTHMGRELLAALGQVVDEGRIVTLDELVKQCLLGPVALVAQARSPGVEPLRVLGWLARTGRSPGMEPLRVAIVRACIDGCCRCLMGHVSCCHKLYGNTV